VQFVEPLVTGGTEIQALGSASDTDDVWSLDARGVLTLSVGKETYEQLGVVGNKLPWKPCQDIHVISISLLTTEAALALARTHQASSHVYGSKTKAALEAWDRRRGPWDVIVSCDDPSKVPTVNETKREVTVQTRKFSHIRIPQRLLSIGPQAKVVDVEEWEEEASALFEWIGLACLGSQRLQANDSVDPYLAVYDPPLRFRTGDLTCLRWTGLLTPSAVQAIINHASSAASEFVAITAQSATNSPATYISPPQSSVRSPRKDGEDTWCLVLAASEENVSNASRNWTMVENLGPYDTRWG